MSIYPFPSKSFQNWKDLTINKIRLNPVKFSQIPSSQIPPRQNCYQNKGKPILSNHPFPFFPNPSIQKHKCNRNYSSNPSQSLPSHFVIQIRNPSYLQIHSLPFLSSKYTLDVFLINDFLFFSVRNCFKWWSTVHIYRCSWTWQMIIMLAAS